MVEDALFLHQKLTIIHGFGEADITETRQRIRASRRVQKEPLSLTSFLMHTFACELAKTPSLQASIIGRRKYIPSEVDLFVPTEVKAENRLLLVPKIFKQADRKSASALEIEYRAFQQGGKTLHPMEIAFLGLPWFLRRLGYRYIWRSPKRKKQQFGTAYFTALHMFAPSHTQGIPAPMHSLGFMATSLSKRQEWHNGELKTKEYLHFTISSDHRINNGAEIVRFMDRLIKAIEKGRYLS